MNCRASTEQDSSRGAFVPIKRGAKFSPEKPGIFGENHIFLESIVCIKRYLEKEGLSVSEISKI